MGKAVAPIVVGLDETPAGKAALRFAIQEASRRNSSVDVVTAWTWQVLTDLPMPSDSREWARAAAQLIQDEAIAAVLSEAPGRAMITRQVVEGDAATVLLRAARAADYLVVGTGRKGTLRRVLLGSVSEQCVRRSSSPVVVVPAPPEHADKDEPERRRAGVAGQVR